MKRAARLLLSALALAALTGCQSWTISLPAQTDPEWAYVTALCDQVTDGKHSYKNGTCRICKAVQPAAPVVVPEPEAPPPPDVVQPEEPLPIGTDEPNPDRPGDYAAGNLWKFESESDGNAVWLASPKFTGHIESTWLEYQGTKLENGIGAGIWNGGRWHSRFRKPGSAYPDGLTSVLRTDSGVRWYYTYPDPGRRYDGTVVPKAVRP
jgi:hypothetical protein